MYITFEILEILYYKIMIIKQVYAMMEVIKLKVIDQ